MPWDSNVDVDKLKAAQAKYDKAHPKPPSRFKPSSDASKAASQFYGKGTNSKLKGYDPKVAAANAASRRAEDAKRAAAKRAAAEKRDKELSSKPMTGIGPGGTTVNIAAATPSKPTPKSSSMSTYTKTLENKGRVEKAKAAAARKATPETKKELKIATRINDGKFKGKYYGPDEFKGNTKLIDEWKKSGKPNRQAFARSRGLSGTKD